jgi:hypothetical protein
MARPLRIEFAGTLYHVTSRGDGRGAIYVQDQDRHVWLEMLGHVCERFNWVVHAYCQMGNTTTCWWKPRTGISPRACDSSTASIRNASAKPTPAWVTSFKAATRRSWCRKRRISSSCPATSCSIPCVPAWCGRRPTGRGATIGQRPVCHPSPIFLVPKLRLGLGTPSLKLCFHRTGGGTRNGPRKQSLGRERKTTPSSGRSR